jgi:hypothetical protein
MLRVSRQLLFSLLVVAVAAAPAAGEAIDAANGLVVEFGSTAVGVPVTATIAFANPSAEREMPFGFDAADDGFEVGVVPEVLAPSERIEVPITLRAETAGEYELIVRIYRDLGEGAAEDGMITFQVVGRVTDTATP